MQKEPNLQPGKSHSRAAANHTQSLGNASPVITSVQLKEKMPGKGAAVVQKQPEEEEKTPPAQFVLQTLPDLPLQQKTPFQLRSNDTGLPGNLKSGVEQLSGFAMDDVKVHYNSQQPAQLGALAYAQGTDIHVAPGQEQHLPHEAWHVVQQKQGRVQPTMQMKEGVPVNDDAGLEKEADEMGSKAVI
jgi:hypothetical protein